MSAWLSLTEKWMMSCSVPVSRTSSPAPSLAHGTNCWMTTSRVLSLVLEVLACAAAARGRDSPTKASVEAKAKASKSLTVILRMERGFSFCLLGCGARRRAGKYASAAVRKSGREHTALPPARSTTMFERRTDFKARLSSEAARAFARLLTLDGGV